MFKLLVILFIIKLYARNDIFIPDNIYDILLEEDSTEGEVILEDGPAILPNYM